VVLVDCDLREPCLHRTFSLPREPGLTDVLRGTNVLADALRSTSIDRLSLLAAGSASPAAGETMDEPRLAALLDGLSASFDLIILDTPAVLEAADATVIGRMVDGCILVVRAGETDRALVRQAQQQLALVGARVIGAVLNDPDARVNQVAGAAGATVHAAAGSAPGWLNA
jgi:capsular exopolysaccharide synthesis family protein